MRIPENINGLVKVCESIYREACRSDCDSGRPELFRLQLAELRARLSALGARQIYLVLATCELGRRMWKPNDLSGFRRFYGCLSSSYTRHCWRSHSAERRFFRSPTGRALPG